MEREDVELVKKIVKDELDTALESEGKRIEANVIASVTAFQERVQREVRQDHAENRTRLQQNYLEAAKSVAQNEFIIKAVDEQKNDMRELRDHVTQLLSEVKMQVGRQAGEAESDARFEKKKNSFYAVMKWLGGVAATAGVWKWIMSYFHWGKK